MAVCTFLQTCAFAVFVSSLELFIQHCYITITVHYMCLHSILLYLKNCDLPSHLFFISHQCAMDPVVYLTTSDILLTYR